MNGTFENIIQIQYLTKENATFYQSGDFLGLKTVIDGEEKDHGIVKLRRLFPFEELWRDISVLAGGEEIGVIADISLFGEDEALLRKELERIYFTPKISKIHSMKEKYGYHYTEAQTSAGRVKFVLNNPSNNIRTLEDGRILITDTDGNCFCLPDPSKLDKQSYRIIEIYL